MSFILWRGCVPSNSYRIPCVAGLHIQQPIYLPDEIKLQTTTANLSNWNLLTIRIGRISAEHIALGQLIHRCGDQCPTFQQVGLGTQFILLTDLRRCKTSTGQIAAVVSAK